MVDRGLWGSFWQWGEFLAVVQARGLAEVFHARRIRAVTLGNMGVRMRSNRFVTVVNPSKYNGSALLGVLNLLSDPARNGC